MSKTIVHNDTFVSDAFSRQSGRFDDIYNGHLTTLWMRDRVRQEVMQHITPNARMLELNCGTGIDSIYFAQQGYSVLATDNAAGMLAQLNRKKSELGLDDNLQTKKWSFNEIGQLGEGQFDYVFSNFGGLNCTDKLYEVLHGIDKVLKPGGYCTLVIMPRICPWEIIMLLRGYFKTAFRRFRKNGTNAHLEGVNFLCYYYNPGYVIKHAGPNLKLCGIKGVCITVPPPFIERFIERHNKAFGFLERIENAIWRIPPFNRWCDHYIITMQKVK